MGSAASDDVGGLLPAWAQGDGLALEKSIPPVHPELRRLAGRYIRRKRAGHILQTTAVVREAHERLIETQRVQWQNRADFTAVCVRLMQRVPVNHALSGLSAKRGSGIAGLTSEEAAEFLKIWPDTVKRDCEPAKVRLVRELSGG